METQGYWLAMLASAAVGGAAGAWLARWRRDDQVDAVRRWAEDRLRGLNEAQGREMGAVYARVERLERDAAPGAAVAALKAELASFNGRFADFAETMRECFGGPTIVPFPTADAVADFDGGEADPRLN
jgi:hypothetical protein